MSLQWGVRIPLRDGVHLNATLYRPNERSEAAPAIFTLTPYVGQTYHDRGVYFSSLGYTFLTVDARGRGNSEGIFTAGTNEAQDAYDVIEWLARQSYCNGRVAMWGGSYGGYVQWAAASERPSHLATIVPVASPLRGFDTPAPNNIFPPYRVQWLTLLAGRTSQELAPNLYGKRQLHSAFVVLPVTKLVQIGEPAVQHIQRVQQSQIQVRRQHRVPQGLFSRHHCILVGAEV